MKRLLLLSSLCILQSLRLDGQQLLSVYPGDVTNNGVVNNLDFLHLGLAYNFAGPARDSAAQDFAPLPAKPWSYQFPGGLNMAYADCNGDGFVNYFFDAFPLYTHYGLQRDSNVVPDVFVPGVPGIDVALQFDDTAIPPLVQGGQVVRIPIKLGTANIPAEDFYGIAFSVSTNQAAINLDQTTFSFSELSWANPDNDRIWMSKRAAPNRLDVGFVRTDRNQKSGQGRIGYVDYVIIVDVIGFQTIPVVINQVKMMDKYGNYTSVAGDTIWLNVAPQSLSSNNDPQHDPAVSIYPNPASDQLYIQADENIQGLQLTDMLGQIVLDERWKRGNSAEMNVSKMPAGLYLLRIETDHGVALRRVQIQK